jgi:amino acid adenylation domain-containing protein
MPIERHGKSNLTEEDLFWKQFLQGITSRTSLGINRVYSGEASSKLFFSTQTVSIPQSASLFLGTLLQEHQIEPSVLLLGAWSILLNRYSSERDVVFGIKSALHNRDANEVDPTYLLPIRVEIEPDKPLLSWLAQLQSQWITLQAYQQTSLAQIVEWTELSGEEPLFESLLLLSGSATSQGKGLQLSEDSPPPELVSFPLIVQADIAQFTLRIEYDRTHFDDATISRLSGHLQTLLGGIAANPHQSIKELPWLTPAERQQLLQDWAQNPVEYPREVTVSQLIEAQVERTPDAISVVFGAQHLTYQELNQRANQLAHHLQTLEVSADIPVGICVERSLEMLVGLLAILKAGGAYVPLDPLYPKQRLAAMLEAANVPVLLTQQHLVNSLPSHKAQIVCLDSNWVAFSQQPSHNPIQPAKPTNLAYIIYTSGSTGTPKGVAMGHLPLVNLLFWQAQQSNPHHCRTLQFTSISFDVSFQEIFSTWLVGGTLVLIADETRRDSQQLFQFLIEQNIERLFLPFVALQNLAGVGCSQPVQPVHLREVTTAGEQLQISRPIADWFSQLPHCTLHNHYGPSESHVVTAYTLTGDPQQWMVLPPIGRPIANACTYILNRQFQPVPIGAIGELYLGGVCLAREYLNRPDLTAERFLLDPFSQEPGARIYKTGDFARYLADGNIEYLGRADSQVKIRGYRIELGEIEATLSRLPEIRDAVVLLREDMPGVKRLVAYVTPKDDRLPSVREIKAYLRQVLPEYMVPVAIVVLDHIPLTPSGKADRRGLPQPKTHEMGEEFVVPGTETEKGLADIWCGVLGLEQVGIEDNFFDLGGSSLLGTQVLIRVQKQFGLNLTIVRIYEHSTIRTLAQHLDREIGQQQKQHSIQEQTQRQKAKQRALKDIAAEGSNISTGIAIIGMAGRFPGSASVDELWQNLCAGVESVSWFTPDELDPSVSPDLRTDPQYVRARGIIQGAETFDAAFFGISPREAEIMDPQARVFLELTHEALENAGYSSETFEGEIGLYAGSGQNTYFERHISGRSEIVDRLGAFQTMLANEKDFITTRASYKLNLKGPSLSINTACSTSLVAVIQAFQALLSYQCDIALAGGVSITTPQNTGYLYQEGGIFSPDGHCRPFDANGQGTLFNNGAGLVVLKRLEDALADGDLIYAVIKGVGMNNDGAGKVSFTAPSVQGQAEAILAAQLSADFHPETISYIEAHGTATPVGDPIEIEALTQAFRTQTAANQFCAIGSIKSNVGHLIAAAGVAGLIKTALALYHKKIPASLNYATPNPAIDFANSPFYVNTQLTDWQTDGQPRRAGVSSFGVGGTNAHVVLEETPLTEPSPISRPRQVLLLSAKTTAALEQATVNLKQHLQVDTAANLADVAYTLQVGRSAFNHRRFVVCSDRDHAIQLLETPQPHQTGTRHTTLRNPPVVFMFPGQGSQYVNMGRNLYEHESVFRATVDRCCEILKPLLERDLREVMYPTAADEETAACLRQTCYTQPALFTIEYALAKLWQSWGLQPTALIGHSIGEFVAACLAGVFSLEDALKLVATRAQMMWSLPSGSMLSVRLSATEVEPYLNAELAIAAINGPSLCVVSGPTDLIDRLQQTLEAQEVICKPLHTSHAFHSPMMKPVIEPLLEMLQDIELAPPQIPFVSTVTTDWITNEQAMDPGYWASHLRETVRFAEGVQTLWQQPDRVLLEVGPRTTTATLARQQAKDLKQQIAISSLGSTAEDHAEWTALLQAIGQLWLAGVAIDWKAFYAAETRHRLPLPTYPFERQRYWIDPLPADRGVSVPAQTIAPSINPVDSVLPLDNSLSPNTDFSPNNPGTSMTDSRKQRLLTLIKEVLETTSGIDLTNADEVTTFLELGFDSLSLTQVALGIKKKFKQNVTFRQLLETYPTLDTLATFLDQSLPVDAFPAPVTTAPVAESPVPTPSTIAPAAVPTAVLPNNNNGNGNGNGISNGHQNAPVLPVPSFVAGGAIETLVAQQLQIMARQLELLGQPGSTTLPPAPFPTVSSPLPPVTPTGPVPPTPAVNSTSEETQVTKSASSTQGSVPAKMHGPGARIEKSTSTALTPAQQTALERIINRYTSRTPESKRQAQEHRRYLSDPRTVSGFTPLLKEMIYPIVVDRSSGSKLWDVDGNEYIDITNGFGSNFFGWSSDFITEAIKAQIDQGIEIGPQTPLAGRVAKLISELTGQERVAFCNTGSEAVMAAMRLARTVTGRSTIAIFSGAYHGTFDEVVIRKGANGRSLPAAPGILPSMVENALVLDYGDPASLEILRHQADDLAAIMVEPVQSRRPDLQPIDFLRELRQITEKSGSAFIIDEVVTGFRVHPGGVQKHFGIQADLSTYGKVIGGGLPIGVVAGKAQFMDALDGGFWQFGDDSFPEVGVTFFAGTFVRHPMALAAAEAVLKRLKEAGPELQYSLAAKVEKFATHLNQHFERVGAPIKIAHFSSFFYIKYPPELPYGGLLYYLLREKEVHIWEYRPCFFSLAHSEVDIEQVSRAFKDSVAEMQMAGFLPSASPSTTTEQMAQYRNGQVAFHRNHPPQPGARLGKDPEGNPAWFIPDPDRPGKYLQVKVGV